MKSFKNLLCGLCLIISAFASWAGAESVTDISLPAPHTEGGMPLMQALKNRETIRSFSEKEIPLQVLSDLLWAAAGINRPESGKRTAPSARNIQEIDVYAVMKDGAYRYDAKANILKGIAKGDFRKLTGTQDFVSSAPLNLLFVADYDKMKGSSPEDQALYSGADTGYISQNVYLFCASEGLATVVRGSVKRAPLAEALKFPENLKIVLAQTVGYPGTKKK